MRAVMGAAVFAALTLLFLIANRGAYQAYFSGDDLANLSWTRHVEPVDLVAGSVKPWYGRNDRPIGHAYFALLVQTAGLRFPWYVAVLQTLHLLNVWVLWLLLRRLGFPRLAAGAGSLFFAFHVGVLEAYWRPMYIFDVLCGLFCLLSLLGYLSRRWVLSLVCFWLAFKSKELAVMLPVILTLYEYWLGEKRWKPLIPFWAVSLIFGAQALLGNAGTNTEYTLQFTPQAISKTVSFYSSQLFLVPYLGLVMLALPLVVRDRRLNWGLAFLCLMPVPVLLLPGRLYGAYLYLPLAGAAIALAALAARLKPVHAAALAAVFFAIWIPWNYGHLRTLRRALLAAANENRTYVATLAQMARDLPEMRTFVYDGFPHDLHVWGVEGALQYLYGHLDLNLYWTGQNGFEKGFQAQRFVMLWWDPIFRTLTAVPRASDTSDVAYFRIYGSRCQPIWQLGTGWHPWEYAFRWIEPYASARLRRPAEARQFELVAHIGPGLIQDLKRTTVQVFLDGQLLGQHEFTDHGIYPLRWKLPAGEPGPVMVEFRVAPEYRPTKESRRMGIAIRGFGFVEN
jgi:hypothetical protein